MSSFGGLLLAPVFSGLHKEPLCIHKLLHVLSVCNSVVSFLVVSMSGRRMDLKSSHTTYISRMEGLLYLLLFMIVGIILKVK